MSKLDDIPIRVEQPWRQDFGNALPILSEIRHALARLAKTGQSTCIDLAAVPFGPGDEERLLELLGCGEVQASIDALGPTRIWETRFPGVWVLDHSNTEHRRIAFQIEVDEVPQILRTQGADLDASLMALDARLEAAADAFSQAHNADSDLGIPAR
ncbi:MAG: hydrogenase expression/formation C-terminal domain-containing protein [Thiohalocapsa sp.]